jgi:hypothetical protein
LTRWQKKDQSIASLTDQKAALSKQLEEFSKVSKKLDDERASTVQLKKQHSLDIKKLEQQNRDQEALHQSALKHNSEEDKVNHILLQIEMIECDTLAEKRPKYCFAYRPKGSTFQTT